MLVRGGPVIESPHLFLVPWALRHLLPDDLAPYCPQGFISEVKTTLLGSRVLPVWSLFPMLLGGSRAQDTVTVTRDGGAAQPRLGAKWLSE